MNIESGFPSADVDLQAYRRIEEIIGKAGIRQTFSPIETLSGLPNAAYWSDDWLQLELDRIFNRHWIFVAADDELSEPGAIKPMQVGGTPIILVKGQDGTVRAFHNVCRHRGTQLVGEACRKPLITCPYHAWSYRLDGTIRARPHFYQAEKTETFGRQGDERLNLYPIRTASWNGCHFIDLSGEAPELADWLAPMLKRTSAFDFSLIRWIGKKTYHIRSNWKFVLENYMEGYHVFAAHARLLEHAPMSVRWQGEWMDHVFYNDYVAPSITKGRGDSLPHFPGLSSEDVRRGMWFVAFPNFAAEVYADQFVILSTYPVSPDETLEELHFFVAGEDARTEERYAPARDELVDMWDKLNQEDVELLERLQRGRKSKVFTGSQMSPAWEGPSHHFSQKVVEALCRN